MRESAGHRQSRPAFLFLALVVFSQFLAFVWSAPGHAQEKIVVGALRFSSSGALFLTRDRGYFKEEGLDVDLAFFEAAPTIAIAVASGSATFGTTALTGAFYNMAGEGNLKIIAGQAREEKGRSGNLVLVTRQAYAAGFTTIDKLFVQPFGLTQYGSPSHFQLGQLAQKYGGTLKDIDIKAFQTLPNLIAAIKSGKVAWAIIAPPIATDLINAGDAVALSAYSDHASYQFGVVFTSAATTQNRPDLVRKFLRAYRRGLQDYAILNDRDNRSDPAKNAAANAAAEIIARYISPNEEIGVATKKVRESALYIDPTGAVDIEDIGRQIRWYREQGMVMKAIDPQEIIRLDFMP